MNISITAAGKIIDYQTLGFSGGERHVQLNDLPREIPEQLNVKATINSSDDLMDLLLINNALKNHYGEEVLLNLEVPYMPYARQDRVCTTGQAFSMELMSQLLGQLRLNQLITWDCHSQVGIDLTGATNVSSTEIIQSSGALVALLKDQNSVLICPDKGALSRCKALQEALGISSMVRCEKRRDPATGKITKTDVLVDDLSGKTAIITDDICDGGYTFIKIAEQLKEKNAEKVVLYVTHGIFSKGIDVFSGLIDLVYTTNSFPNNPDTDSRSQLRVIDYTYDFNSNSK